MRTLRCIGKFPGTKYGASLNHDTAADFGCYFWHGKALNAVDIVGNGNTASEAKADFIKNLAEENG